MLQTLSSQQPGLYEGRDQDFDLKHYFAVFRKRILYFAIPFIILLIVGCFIVAVQRPIYEAAGEILVESPEIPTSLVEPTVTASATERIEVIQQRIMTRDNLMGIVNKFGLFPSEREWMSATQLLDLMRNRAAIQLVDITTAMTTNKDGRPVPQPNLPANKANSAIAFTMSFDYENPQLAEKVANEFLTLILNEDVRSRTSHATETTQFLGREVDRLQGQINAINAKISGIKQQPGAVEDSDPEQLKSEMAELVKLKADLIQATSVYSDAHPVVKSLRKRVAALEQQISQTPKASSDSTAQGAASPGSTSSGSTSSGTTSPASPSGVTPLDLLENQQKELEKELDDAREKLNTARLGESMERDQQAEHLTVIEQPNLPQKPIKPNKPKLFAIAFAAASMVAFGVLVAAEMLDKTIRGPRDLAGIIDSHLIVAVPYISTVGEVRKRKRRFILLCISLGLILLSGVAVAFYIGVDLDSLGIDASWTYYLTRLTK